MKMPIVQFYRHVHTLVIIAWIRVLEINPVRSCVFLDHALDDKHARIHTTLAHSAPPIWPAEPCRFDTSGRDKRESRNPTLKAKAFTKVAVDGKSG